MRPKRLISLSATLPLAEGQTVEQLCEEVFPVIFDPTVHESAKNLQMGTDDF